MPTVTFKRPERGMTIDQLANLLAIVTKELEWLITGNLDVANIRANGIEANNIKAGAVTADKINVDELSAISANLGTITAGLVQSIQIFGSYIATANGTFPRCEMSTTANLFRAFGVSEDDYVGVTVDFLGNGPGFVAVKGGTATGGQYSGLLEYHVNGIADLILESGTNIYLKPNGIDGVVFGGFGEIYSESDSQSLQSALDAKANAFTGFSGSFSTGTQTVTVVNGIITSVV